MDTAPFGTYADVTGVVDSTAASEIVALGTELKRLIARTSYTEHDAGRGDPEPDVAASEAASPSPEFDRIPRDVANLIDGEIDGLLAAIAAAPTA